MSIQDEELVFRKAAVNSDSAANGGRMSPTAIVSGVTTNIFPHVRKQERIDGVVRKRKIFLHVSNTEDLTYIAPSFFIDKYTAGDDAVSMHLGTQTDTQADLTGSERMYGSGQLNADVTVGGSTISVATEGQAFDHFQNGDKVRITDMDNVLAGTGNEQIVTIDSAPSYAGDVATFTIAETLGYNFTAASTRVMSVIATADLSTDVASLVVTTAGSGDYDDVAQPILAPNLSAIEQNWTLTVSNGATTFTVVGDTVGNLGDFSIGSDVSPANPDWLSAYFTLYSAGLSGTFADGDTITFTTHPNSLPLWLVQTVPAGANNLTGNSFSLGTKGESE